MKLFGIEITRTKMAEKFKGFFDTGYGAKPTRKHFYLGEHSWLDRCTKFDRLCEAHPLAKQTLQALGGQVIANGIYVQPTEDYARAKEAAEIIEKLNDEIHFKQLLFDASRYMGKYGSCFLEKTWTPTFNVRIIPQQERIEPEEQDEESNIVKWRQPNQASWSLEEIVPLHWDVSSQSWPYGTSMLVGLDTEFQVYEDLEINTKDYMEKQAWPYTILQIGDKENPVDETELSTAKTKFKNRRIGEDMITTVPTQLLQGGTGGSPIRELSDLLQVVKDNIQDSLILPAISKLYNSTEASAKVLTSWAASCVVKPMQEILRNELREKVYKPYLEDLGYSVKVCPDLLFEPPDAQKKEEMEFWTGMVNAGICPPQVAAREFGWEDEWKTWQIEKQAQQEKIFQRKKEEKSGEEEDKKGEDEDVYEVHHKRRASGRGNSTN